MTKTVTIEVHERTVYALPRLHFVRPDGSKREIHPGMLSDRPLDRIEVSGSELENWAVHARRVNITRMLDGTIVDLDAPRKPDLEKVANVQALVDAMWQLLDDMGEDGHSVSPAAKEQALKAFEPFDEKEDPYAELDWPDEEV